MLWRLSVVLLTASINCQSPWREDGRCGASFPLDDGQPGQCDPAGDAPRVGPCCSPKGFCGNTKNHCKCKTCLDFSKIAAEEADKEPVEIAVENSEESNESEEAEEAIQPLKKTAETGSDLDPQVDVGEGRLRGRQADGTQQFWGVPYARPPLGALRFQRPEPPRAWQGVREAGHHSDICPQYLENPKEKGKLVGSEDCLYLNIFTPDKSSREKRPVMIWFHGGGFTQGSGNSYRPTRLVKKGVIVVTINYRLGSLGFLTFGNSHMTGNMGLWDQALAIRWVRNNIVAFGGDRDQITIFGESAGAMSVHAQVLSPQNYGLLAGGIAQSGTLLMQHLLPGRPNRVQAQARKVVGSLGCGGLMDARALQCLQALSMEDVMAATKSRFANLGKQMKWGPVVDDYADLPFLPLPPLQAMKEGKFNRIPFISGTVQNDGAFFLPFVKRLVNKENFAEVMARLLPLQSNLEAPTSEHRLLAHILWKYYNHPSENKTSDKCVSDFITSGMFLVPDQVTVGLMSRFSDHVYNYQLTQAPTVSLLGSVFGLDADRSLLPLHADALPYLFEIEVDNNTVADFEYLQFSEDEKSLAAEMVQLWTNFAKTGRPSTMAGEDWTPVLQGNKAYLELVGPNPVLKSGLEEEQMLLWERLVWGPREETIDRKIIYEQATRLLTGSVIKK